LHKNITKAHMSQDLTHMAATETGGKENETYIYIYVITQNQRGQSKLNPTCTIRTSLPKFTIYIVKRTLI
jgi:hypothetical protein